MLRATSLLGSSLRLAAISSHPAGLMGGGDRKRSPTHSIHPLTLCIAPRLCPGAPQVPPALRAKEGLPGALQRGTCPSCSPAESTGSRCRQTETFSPAACRARVNVVKPILGPGWGPGGCSGYR